jgi:hypothetical protein
MSITSESGECFGERKKKKKMKAAWLLRSHCGQAACVGAAQLVWWRAAGARHLGPRLGQVRCGLRGLWQAGLAPVCSLFRARVCWHLAAERGCRCPEGFGGCGRVLSVHVRGRLSLQGSACGASGSPWGSVCGWPVTPRVCVQMAGSPAGPCAGQGRALLLCARSKTGTSTGAASAATVVTESLK